MSVLLRAPHPVPQISLRLRQREALSQVARHYQNGVCEQLVVLPTGYGKTLLALFLASCFKRALFITPSIELENQTLAAWTLAMPGVPAGRIKGRQEDYAQRLTIATPQTLSGRLARLPRNAFDLVIVDEAHHAGTRQMVSTLSHFQHSLRLGVTATPERYDGVPLDQLFKAITYSVSLADAVRDGVLARPLGLQVCTRVSLQAALRGGDYDLAQLEKIVNIPARNALVVNTWLKQASERLTIAFCASVEHAVELARVFARFGIKAEATWGDDPERAAKVARLRLGLTRVLCNCNVLSEGFDCPEVSCVLLTRPTRSRTRFVQQAGRGLRQFPGKVNGLIVLFQDEVVNTLGTTLWDFVGAPTSSMTQDGGAILSEPRDLLLALEKRENRETARRSATQALSQIARLEGQISKLDLLKPPPDEGRVRAWGGGGRETSAATKPQLEKLSRLGYDVTTASFSKRDAFALIASALAEEAASPGMLERLKRHGYDTRNYRWTHGQAESALLSALTGQRADVRPGIARA